MTDKPYYLPGDKQHKNDIDALLRVDHAGEYGAVQIYRAQIKTCRNTKQKQLLEHMLQQEQEHLNSFNNLLNEHKIRPSLLMPLWHFGGTALGTVTAKIGNNAAMACTEAIENTIDEHYKKQIDTLKTSPHKKLRNTLKKFRSQELEHRDTAIAHGAQDAPAYKTMSRSIRRMSQLAIWIAERL